MRCLLTTGIEHVSSPILLLQDCTRLFGSMRSSKYVAQDNLELLAEGQLPMRIVHRALVNFFEGWSPSHRR